jgi:hypothetical protein
MPDLTQQAQPAVEKLLKADESQLYEQLGIRAKAMAQDPAKSGSFEPEVTYEAAQMGFKEDVKDFGQRLFKLWSVEAYKLVCSTEAEDQQTRTDLLNAFGVSETAVAALLASLLVAQLGVAPAIAAVVAALIIKRFFRPAYQEFCVTWKKSVEGAES